MTDNNVMIAQKAAECARNKIEQLGYELVDTEYGMDDGLMCLTYYVYSLHGVSTDDCETISRAIEETVEQADPTDGKAYCLCVSSPGERPFKTERDFERNLNNTVSIEYLKPVGKKKKIHGVMLSFDDNSVTLKDKKGTETVAERNNIKVIKPYIGF